MKKGVLEKFAKFIAKHLWFAKFSRKPFLQNTSGRLPLAFPCNFTKMGALLTVFGKSQMNTHYLETLTLEASFISFSAA